MGICLGTGTVSLNISSFTSHVFMGGLGLVKLYTQPWGCKTSQVIGQIARLLWKWSPHDQETKPMVPQPFNLPIGFCRLATAKMFDSFV